MEESKFLKVAKQAALEAGRILSELPSELTKLSVKNEDNSDLVSNVDVEVEKLIIKILTDHFPDHNIIAEEGDRVRNGSLYTWVIDPLDGTFSFMRNIPYFSVSIGLLKDNKPIMGVINHVSLHNLYWAEEGNGAYLNGKKIYVSKVDSLDQSGGVLDLGHMQKRKSKIDLYVNPLIAKIGYVYSLGGAAAILSMVAQGVLDLDVNQAWLWDFVAGTVIVREAGGKVTDFSGNEPDWTKERLDIVASNGLIHEQILEALSPSLRGTK